MSVALTSRRSSNAARTSAAARPSRRVHSAMNGEAGSCAWRPPTAPAAAAGSSRVRPSSSWRASVARLSAAAEIGIGWAMPPSVPPRPSRCPSSDTEDGGSPESSLHGPQDRRPRPRCRVPVAATPSGAHAAPRACRRRGGTRHDSRTGAERRGGDRLRGPLRGRQAPPGHDPPAGPRAEAPHPDQPRRPAVRRRALGPPRPPAARRVRRPAPRPRRRGALPRDAARRGAGGSRGARAGSSTGRSRRSRSVPAWPTRSRAYLDEVDADHARRPPHRRPDGPGGGRAAQGQGRRRRWARAQIAKRLARRVRDASRTTSSCGRCPTATSPATRPPGSTAASSSTRCTGRPAGSRPSTSRRSTASTRCSATPGFEFWYSREEEGESFGRASSEGGDIMPIGNRTVAIGMSERTTGQMIEKIALALFAKGAADRVIAAGMTRDRAHMHLDTVFTFLDRDVRDDVPQGRGLDHRLLGPPGRQARASSTSGARTRSSTRSRTRSSSRSCASSAPAATRGRPSASSGTTATTSWRSSPASSSRTSERVHQHAACARPGIEVITLDGSELGRGPRRRPLHDLPAAARSRLSRPASGHRTDTTMTTPRRPPQPPLPQAARLHRGRDPVPARPRGQLKAAKQGGFEVAAAPQARRSASSSRRPRRARAARSRSPPTTRAPTSPTSTRSPRRWATRSRSRTPRACSAACTTASSTAASTRTIVETLAAVRRRAGLERPHRRVPPDPDPRRHPDDARALVQAARADQLRVPGRRRQQHGQLAAGRRRACWAWTSGSSAPKDRWPDEALVDEAQGDRQASRAPGSP